VSDEEVFLTGGSDPAPSKLGHSRERERPAKFQGRPVLPRRTGVFQIPRPATLRSARRGTVCNPKSVAQPGRNVKVPGSLQPQDNGDFVSHLQQRVHDIRTTWGDRPSPLWTMANED
jgi:hypothetical protein